MSGGKVFTFLLVLTDLFMFYLAFTLSYWFRFASGVFPAGVTAFDAYLNLGIFSGVIILFVFGFTKLYRVKRSLFSSDEFFSVFKSLLLGLLIVTAATFLYKATLYSRQIILLTFVFSLFTITLSRSTLRKALGELRKRGFDKRKVVIVGADQVGQILQRKFKENKSLGYEFIGYINNNKKGAVIGKPKDLEKIIQEKEIDTVFITPAIANEKIMDMVMKCQNTEFRIVPNLLEIITEPLSFDEFQDIPLISLKKTSAKEGYEKEKRTMDVVVSLLILVVLSPLLAVIAALVKLSSKGPILFKQTRVGKDGREFVFYKFRTMREGSEKLKKQLRGLNEVEGLFKIENDPRITPLGRILRRTCLDELPQLFNVFKGDMSLVGPRPHLPQEMKNYGKWKDLRLSVKPGITGLWQVGGRHELMFEKAIALDLYYIKHRSLSLDFEILVKTIPSIVFSSGKW